MDEDSGKVPSREVLVDYWTEWESRELQVMDDNSMVHTCVCVCVCVVGVYICACVCMCVCECACACV